LDAFVIPNETQRGQVYGKIERHDTNACAYALPAAAVFGSVKVSKTKKVASM
jgi:hypothetical protein